MKIFSSVSEWINFRASANPSLGFVPTMGALHQGHLELVKQSQAQCEESLVSIFINPTQFDNKDDLEKYPVSLDEDIALLKELGTTYLLIPKYEELYADNYNYKVTESQFSAKLCGESRPGHFDGVLTVVLKLLNIAKCEKAFFGEKDFQQLSLVKAMVESFFIDTKIIAVPTQRESDGLALSSRNKRLDENSRRLAPEFFRELKNASSASAARRNLDHLGFEVDYVEDINSRRFGAVRLGQVRLIDNVSL